MILAVLVVLKATGQTWGGRGKKGAARYTHGGQSEATLFHRTRAHCSRFRFVCIGIDELLEVVEERVRHLQPPGEFFFFFFFVRRTLRQGNDDGSEQLTRRRSRSRSELTQWSMQCKKSCSSSVHVSAVLDRLLTRTVHAASRAISPGLVLVSQSVVFVKTMCTSQGQR